MSSLLRLLPILVVLTLSIFFSTLTYAQSLSQANYNYTPVYQDKGNSVNTTLGAISNNFDLRWLALLILIPLGLLVKKDSVKPLKTNFYKPSNNSYQISYHDIWRDKKKRSLTRKKVRRFFKSA